MGIMDDFYLPHFPFSSFAQFSKMNIKYLCGLDWGGNVPFLDF